MFEAKNKFNELVTFLKQERKQAERLIQLREKDEVGKKGNHGKYKKTLVLAYIGRQKMLSSPPQFFTFYS